MCPPLDLKLQFDDVGGQRPAVGLQRDGPSKSGNPVKGLAQVHCIVQKITRCTGVPGLKASARPSLKGRQSVLQFIQQLAASLIVTVTRWKQPQHQSQQPRHSNIPWFKVDMLGNGTANLRKRFHAPRTDGHPRSPQTHH